MIGSLRGTLLERMAAGEVLVEVGGVGYRATVPASSLAALGAPGEVVFLFTSLHVRDDALTLYGFASREERRCFEALLGAHGVGPALALTILSTHRPDALRTAVAENDVDALCLVPGVGRKTAARLLLELKARLDLPDEVDLTALGVVDAGPPAARSDVREALASLGYGAEEVREAVRDLPAEGDSGLLLKAALARLAAPANGRGA